MAKPRSRKGGAGEASKTPADPWTKLTWGELEDWAGSGAVSRGRTYQRGGRVRDLAISADGDLLATVSGTERYTTTVSLTRSREKIRPESSCTCPVGFACKHAVATVAEYLQAIADGRAVPVASEDDPRWDSLEDERADDHDEDEDDIWDDDEEEDDEDEDEVPAPRPRASMRQAKREDSPTGWDGKIERHIREKTQTELADLAWSLVRRFPEVYQEFRERIALQQGDIAQLLGQTRREITRVTSDTAWSNRWDGSGYIPDYSPIRNRFERLLELGYPDEVVALGREFIAKGFKQVAEAEDEEGETAGAFAECLPVIFRAALRSSLSPAERLLLAIETEMADDIDTVGEATEVIFNADYEPKDWSSVADTLADRLAAMPAPGAGTDRFSRNYGRDGLTSWIGEALGEAGRDDEVGALYESEARITGSYERLVNYQLEARRFDDAERWAKEGIAATHEKSPGISTHLAAKLAEIAKGRKQWDVVAAHAAIRFLDHPGPSSFDELMKAAKKARVEPKVRELALRFLETGIAPIQAASSPKPAEPARMKTAKAKSRAVPSPPAPVAMPARPRVDPDWPLPVPDELVPLLGRRNAYDQGPRPRLDVLLEMAIAAKKPEEVLHWYDRMNPTQPRPGVYSHAGGYADRVAEAVGDSHPERALEIYTTALNAQLPKADFSAYENAARYLRKLRPIYDLLGRPDDWKALVASIREKYRNRPRFMEILDRLDGRTILASTRPKPKV